MSKIYSLAVLSTPLILGLSSIFGFSLKSIKLLKAQSEFVQKSTIIYIRNLRLFSIAQIIVYGPWVYFFVGIAGVSDYKERYIVLLSQICTSIANLSGFINVILFLSQGSMNYSVTPLDQMDLDLTQDISLSP